MFKLGPPALTNAAAFIAAPLAGEAVRTRILLPAAQTFRHIDHAAIVR
ncbi:MAG: hypothetical protein JRF05_08890 [Deltaproteobacteria bacterium]|nr:hypothetical protein [Deltaproteobacteria bacterium]